MIKAIVFDCFGVLVTDALEAIVGELRATDPDTAAQIISTVAAANKGIISTEVSRTNISALLGLTKDEYVSKIRSGEVKNRELLDYILQLRAQYKVALLSNISSQGLEVRFNSVDQAKYFDTAVASSVIGYAKPEAKAYEITADRLGVRPSECVLVDDREEYCDGARRIGMPAILYMSVPQMKRDLAPLGVQVPER